MNDFKIRLMKRHPFAVGLFLFELIVFGFMTIFAIIDKKYLVALIFILLIVLVYFLCFISDIYGIKIRNEYIVFKDEEKRKKYLIKDINNIEIRFIKKKCHYVLKLKVNFNNTYEKQYFSWDEIPITRIGYVKTRINEDNINEYISLFKSLDKFYVYPVK